MEEGMASGKWRKQGEVAYKNRGACVEGHRMEGRVGLAQMSPVRRPHSGDSLGDKSGSGSVRKNTIFCPPSPRRVPSRNLHPSPVITPHLSSGDPEAQGGDVTSTRCHGWPRARREPPASRGRIDTTQRSEFGGLLCFPAALSLQKTRPPRPAVGHTLISLFISLPGTGPIQFT